VRFGLNRPKRIDQVRRRDGGIGGLAGRGARNAAMRRTSGETNPPRARYSNDLMRFPASARRRPPWTLPMTFMSGESFFGPAWLSGTTWTTCWLRLLGKPTQIGLQDEARIERTYAIYNGYSPLSVYPSRMMSWSSLARCSNTVRRTHGKERNTNKRWSVLGTSMTSSSSSQWAK
jgi:hypothetical protein